MKLRQVADMLLRRPDSPDSERVVKAVQTEELRSEIGAALDRVDRIVPPRHRRLASYARVRVGR